MERKTSGLDLRSLDELGISRFLAGALWKLTPNAPTASISFGNLGTKRVDRNSDVSIQLIEAERVGQSAV
jgi:hypothetical protein